jgi:thioredoxin-dependent peroxiredoxin
VVDKAGKVLLAEPGSPAGTVDAVKKLVAAHSTSATKDETVTDKATNGEAAEEKKDEERAEEKPAE